MSGYFLSSSIVTANISGVKMDSSLDGFIVQ